jgi:Flp pilus assembly protein TadD
MAAMAARLLVLVLALAGTGFLAVQERSARAADRITGTALGKPGAAAVREAQALERIARRLSPDTQPTLDLGIVESLAGLYGAAGERFSRVARAEPENVRAWALLCLAAPRYDSGSAVRACARARALAPPVLPAR